VCVRVHACVHAQQRCNMDRMESILQRARQRLRAIRFDKLAGLGLFRGGRGSAVCPREEKHGFPITYLEAKVLHSDKVDG
jgi:hypothetical protein